MAALSYKAEKRQMDTDQKAKHQPGGMAAREVWGRQRDGQTEGEINFFGLENHLDPSVFLA